jgi:hypothetical protein
MIISKMNSTFRNTLVRDYFLSLTKQISGCEVYIVKYGQPILYTKYKGIEFTDQKITSYFVRLNDHVVNVMVESVFEDFAKTFDILTCSSEGRVKWGLVTENGSAVDPLFKLLNSFVNAVLKLTLLAAGNPDSLMRKKFGIKNVNVTERSI